MSTDKDNSDSISDWIEDLKGGSDSAAEQLWERYFDKLVRQAKKQLGTSPRRVADEEDVAVSVFDSLCKGAAEGRFKELGNRNDLWKLLVVITKMKSVDQIRKQTAKKRGGATVRGDSLVDGMPDNEHKKGFDYLEGDAPTPEFLAEMEERQTELMNSLDDETLKAIVKLRLEGYNNDEIAQKLNTSLRSIERKLMLIRRLWLLAIDESIDS